MKSVMMLLKQEMMKLFLLKTLNLTHKKLLYSMIMFVIKTKNHWSTILSEGDIKIAV